MKCKLTTTDLVAMGIMVGIIEVAKISLSLVLGVELVTLLFILSTLVFEKKTFYLLGSFLLVEGVLNGFGIWWIMYVYIWALLIFIVLRFKHCKSIWFWSTLSGIFGFTFGALCCPIYYFVGGLNMAVSWWIAGISTDIAHGVSNFLLCMVLFVPLRRLLEKVIKKENSVHGTAN